MTAAETTHAGCRALPRGRRCSDFVQRRSPRYCVRRAATKRRQNDLETIDGGRGNDGRCIGNVCCRAVIRSRSKRAEAEIIGFHELCNKGDRRACVRFGILIGRNEQRHADWRRAHADWWWWEKQ